MKIRKTIFKILMFTVVCLLFSAVYTTQSYAKSTKVAKYGYSQNGKWSYHILDAKKKIVEIRPATLDKSKNGVNKGNVKIPSTIKIKKKKYTVTKIAKCAFSVCICDNCYSLGQTTKQRWEDAGKYGDDNIFQSYHKSVTGLSIPATVTNIGDYAFGGQKSLNSLTFATGSKLQIIGNYSFACTSIKSLAIPGAVKTIGSNAFRECASLGTLTFSGNVLTSIGENAFIEHSLNNLSIPASCKTIGDYAFADGAKLKTVTVNATDVTNYKKTLFDGASVNKFYVKNHSVYSKLKKAFSNNTILMKAEVISEQTLVHIKFGDTTKDVYVNRNQSIDYSKYCNFDEGRKAGKTEVLPVKDFKGTNGKSREISGTNTYTATGYPEEYINVTDCDITYQITNLTSYEFKEELERHYGCDWGHLVNYQYCYFDEITFAPLPTDRSYDKEGYKITGYNINGKVYLPGQSIYGIEFDGKWDWTCDFNYDPISYTVTYDVNGGTSETIYPNICDYGEEYSLPSEIPTNNGLKFVGWCTDVSGEGIVYSVGSQFKNLTTEEGAVVTLYAKWSEEPVSVILDLDGGTCSTSSLTIPCGDNYGSLPTPEKTGYDFLGWRIKNTEYATADSKVKNYDHTLTAIWGNKELTIKLNANGGVLDNINSDSMLYGSKWHSFIRVSREGYWLQGWYTAATGGTAVNSKTTLTSDMTLYAHWKLIERNVELSVKPKGLKKADGYQIKCMVNGKKVYKKKVKLKSKKKKRKKVTYTFKKAHVKDTLVMKVRCYKYVKKKGKKKIKWYGWKTVKYTVKY